mmetsp:Transcript_51159/g.81137  ORF Transcript_51159/g.81137 Transcript_51159/m.81137 type:complete len:261 (-) Transcript_51159:289-1071(-)
MHSLQNCISCQATIHCHLRGRKFLQVVHDIPLRLDLVARSFHLVWGHFGTSPRRDMLHSPLGIGLREQVHGYGSAPKHHLIHVKRQPQSESPLIYGILLIMHEVVRHGVVHALMGARVARMSTSSSVCIPELQLLGIGSRFALIFIVSARKRLEVLVVHRNRSLHTIFDCDHIGACARKILAVEDSYVMARVIAAWNPSLRLNSIQLIEHGEVGSDCCKSHDKRLSNTHRRTGFCIVRGRHIVFKLAFNVRWFCSADSPL